MGGRASRTLYDIFESTVYPPAVPKRCASCAPGPNRLPWPTPFRCAPGAPWAIPGGTLDEPGAETLLVAPVRVLPCEETLKVGLETELPREGDGLCARVVPVDDPLDVLEACAVCEVLRNAPGLPLALLSCEQALPDDWRTPLLGDQSGPLLGDRGGAPLCDCNGALVCL